MSVTCTYVVLIQNFHACSHHGPAGSASYCAIQPLNVHRGQLIFSQIGSRNYLFELLFRVATSPMCVCASVEGKLVSSHVSIECMVLAPTTR